MLGLAANMAIGFMVIMGYQDVETNFKLAYLQNKNKYLIGIVPRKGK